MEEQVSNIEQSADTQGSDIFLGTDLFDEVIGSLSQIYFRLWNVEKMKCHANPDLIKRYYQRYQQISALKKRFPVNSRNRRDKAAIVYGLELKLARIILQREADL
ncbi:hypothetical protein [Dyadobacter sp. NIV53]|uniref:hypothetical protein n=1 Tax=Dyadobacter sp. NIV53 TaxID=2861765 RepID=UPI001C86D871|nr:hypothetical protein [Dyadobacter sp. NIV53]